eukprot:TRINITY_DN40072_c0_g1_i1.p1 TRINITY_DN40072_c0_g1~~TRINITY_DN40072_c0_g1_i1.p1  ORF type:complete len:375 (-),score=36.12 TRINITY_DN40072_c0_g1_i1:49-1134(-)
MGNVIRPMWIECPAFTRCLLCSYVGVSCLSMLIPENLEIETLFACNLYNLVDHKAVWSIFTSLVFRPPTSPIGLLMTLLEMFFGMTCFPLRERGFGSTIFMLWCFVTHGLISICLLLLELVLPVLRIGISQMGQGVFPLEVVCLTLDILSDFTGSSSFAGLITIPNKWYPLFLAGLISLLSSLQLGQLYIGWELVIANAIGYAYTFYKLEQRVPDRARVSHWEQRCCATRRNVLGAPWLLAFEATGIEAQAAVAFDMGRFWSGGSGSGNAGGAGGNSADAAAANVGDAVRSFVAFASQGLRLGGDSRAPGREATPEATAASAPAQGAASVPERATAAAAAAAAAEARQVRAQTEIEMTSVP